MAHKYRGWYNSYNKMKDNFFLEFGISLAVSHATHEPEINFAKHQRNSQRSTIVVVIISDGELLTSALNSVAGEMLPVRTGHYPSSWFWLNLAKIIRIESEILMFKKKNRGYFWYLDMYFSVLKCSENIMLFIFTKKIKIASGTIIFFIHFLQKLIFSLTQKENFRKFECNCEVPVPLS